VDPDVEFERALETFTAAILSFETAPEFVDDVAAFATRISRPGMWNALARTTLQLSAPGVPDIYQGDELWNFLLVDPDNRRPVDFARRHVLLNELSSVNGGDDTLGARFLGELLRTPEDGRLKLHLVQRLLQTRARHADIFGGGGYQALRVHGPAAEHVFAFLRGNGSAAAMIAVPRLLSRHLRAADGLPPGRDFWSETYLVLPPDLPRGPRKQVLTGAELTIGSERIDVGDLFDPFPVAVLVPIAAN
jgi:(1->4)-alpha-D-glucan 1-alpha-D-glucosylmutase